MGPASPVSRLLALLREDESGLGLIEVVVSAMLLVLVASGLYLGLDAASATSGTNKHRSIASALAQQDQDRLRAMAVTELSNYRETYTTAVGPVTYTVRSSASWVTDETGTASCSSEDARAHYLRIASSVTYPSMRIEPVAIESVVAPPVGSFGTNLGSLAVQVRDRDGEGVPGVTVSLSGAQSHVGVTNGLGCVLWGYLPVGSYDVTIAKAGHVDPNAVSQPAKEAGVVGEATSTVAFDYDLGGRIQVAYETLRAGEPAPASWTEATAVNPHLTVPLPPIGDGTPQPAYTSGLVYPFAVPYAVYAGRCAGADPLAHGARQPQAPVEPGGIATVQVRLPPVDLRAIRNDRPVAGASAIFTATDSGCDAVVERATGSDGFLLERGLPYGSYAVCVEGSVGGSTYHATGTVDNVSESGVPAEDARFELTATGGCP